jgi:hypothetical protein
LGPASPRQGYESGIVPQNPLNSLAAQAVGRPKLYDLDFTVSQAKDAGYTRMGDQLFQSMHTPANRADVLNA